MLAGARESPRRERIDRADAPAMRRVCSAATRAAARPSRALRLFAATADAEAVVAVPAYMLHEQRLLVSKMRSTYRVALNVETQEDEDKALQKRTPEMQIWRRSSTQRQKAVEKELG